MSTRDKPEVMTRLRTLRDKVASEFDTARRTGDQHRAYHAGELAAYERALVEVDWLPDSPA